MAIGILTIRGEHCLLDFKTTSGVQMGIPFRRPSWADLTDKYAVLLSVKEEDDCISNVQILAYMEVY